jgi:hypothetical protein
VSFLDAANWEKHTKKQHPLYRTASHSFGSRAPVTQEMQSVHHGLSNHFTNSFRGGMHRDYGLNTSGTFDDHYPAQTPLHRKQVANLKQS